MAKKKVGSDIDIAQAAKMLPIGQVAKKLGLKEDELEYYGKYKAKVELSVLDRLKKKKSGKLIDVT
ncbi:MAG: formate--tetrahydrofolate ligase, partial [Nitrospirota bacterium]